MESLHKRHKVDEGKMDDKAMAAFDMRKMFKEGQKFPTPIQADSTRAFYESLIQEKPESKIAIRYCIEYGIFPVDEHNRILLKFNKLRDQGEFNAMARAKALQLAAKKKKQEMKQAKTEKKDKKEKKEKKEKKQEKDQDGDGAAEGKVKKDRVQDPSPV